LGSPAAKLPVRAIHGRRHCRDTAL